MEKELNIRLDAKQTAYGKYAGNKSQPLVIVVHGLPCSIMEGLYERACFWFAEHGYATYRFNLYGWQKDARQLMNCTLTTHANDLDVIVAHFRRKGHKKVFVIGHSFGGPTIFLSKQQAFDAAVLWDPSYGLSFTKKNYGYPGGKFVKALNGYVMPWGANVVLSKAMARQIDELDWDALSETFQKPLKIFAAEKGVLVKGCQRYLEAANQPKALTVVKGATHYFDNTPRMQERLFAASEKWLKKFRTSSL